MSDKPILFISDLHLEEARPDITQAFFSFLQTQAVNSQALFILGDFFNVWLGDDHVTELSNSVANQLSTLAQSGVKIFLMHGNRDFLMGDKFAKACQATLIEEPYLLKAFGENILLMHGDVLCTLDHDYINFRNLVRSPQWQQDFLNKAIAERIAFAAEARETSTDMNSNIAEDIMDVTSEAVIELLEAHQIQTLIHGHTHRPKVHTLETTKGNAQRFVLGDWGVTYWYISLSVDGMFLLNEKING